MKQEPVWKLKSMNGAKNDDWTKKDLEPGSRLVYLITYYSNELMVKFCFPKSNMSGLSF